MKSDSIFDATSKPSDVPLQGMRHTVTPATANTVIVLLYNGTFSNSHPRSGCTFSFYRDGVRLSEGRGAMTAAANQNTHISLYHMDEKPAVASHVYEMRWRSEPGGTLCTSLNGQFTWLELQR